MRRKTAKPSRKAKKAVPKQAPRTPPKRPQQPEKKDTIESPHIESVDTKEKGHGETRALCHSLPRRGLETLENGNAHTQKGSRQKDEQNGIPGHGLEHLRNAIADSRESPSDSRNSGSSSSLQKTFFLK